METTPELLRAVNGERSRQSDRYLIVNADDFGLTAGVNRGIIEAHRNGIVTSASLMVRAKASLDAVTLARANPHLGLGLHLDMGEWVLREGQWIARYEYANRGDANAAAAEVVAQVARFVELTGRLPDHIDSHQHVHLSWPELSEVVLSVADRLGIGLRGRRPQVAYRGMYGQDRDGNSVHSHIGPHTYVATIRSLGAGITEIGCHPGYAEGLESDYRMERAIELVTLCDARVRAAVVESAVRLISWRDIR